MGKRQSNAFYSRAFFGGSVGGGPPSAGQAEPRTGGMKGGSAFSPHGGYRVTIDRMAAGRVRMRKKRKSPRSQPFIDPEDFTMHEVRFPSMFALTTQPVGSAHGVGTSPSAATHPAGQGRFLNVVDGPTIKRGRRKRTGMVGAGSLVPRTATRS